MNATSRAGLRELAAHESPLVMPVLSFPGGPLTRVKVREMVSDPAVQVRALLALHRRFQTRVILGCMDLSVEAEAFGAEVQFVDDEVPRVTGRRLTCPGDLESMRSPQVGVARTAVALEVVRRLGLEVPEVPVLGGVTGPFSLAARLLGVSEALMLTLDHPEFVHAVVKKCTTFLVRYVTALRDRGAIGVLMADPTAGLLAPRAMATFASPYVRRIVERVEMPGFTVVLHNCAAKAAHLPALLESGAEAFHFGAPMDLRQACDQVPPGHLVCGNLDPAKVFVGGDPASVTESVKVCLANFGRRPGYVLSSGCDLPANTPLANLEMFFKAARQG
ncbi:MAG: uroporphyrinogen decarboxylase family protein [Verrucomicrobiales bacterium]|nr:uroporphyrinogen decarboxylase family protein [Verrucomicrobiales bacterium]